MNLISGRPPMPPQSWRRRDFRFPARDAIVNGGSLEGDLLDIAQSGMAIETDIPLRIGSAYQFKVKLDDASFLASGIVRWCVLRQTRRNRRGEHVPVYHTGFSLEDRDEGGHEKVLARLRQRLLTPSEQRPSARA